MCRDGEHETSDDEKAIARGFVEKRERIEWRETRSIFGVVPITEGLFIYRDD
jgi:hypothetical protein